jgi:uncharacterized membrane protein
MPSDQPQPEVARETSAERLMLFSDAVLAIALTLLALELPVPEGDGNAGVLHSAYGYRWEYLAFLISFMVIGAHWRAHHRVFRDVAVVGGRITSVNMYWLLTQVITPFATKVLTGDGGFEIRFGFYAGVQVVSFLLFMLMIWQVRKYGLDRGATSLVAFRSAMWQSGMLTATFLLSIPVVLLVGRWAFVCWAVIPIAGNLIERRIRAHVAPGSTSTAQ